MKIRKLIGSICVMIALFVLASSAAFAEDSKTEQATETTPTVGEKPNNPQGIILSRTVLNPTASLRPFHLRNAKK